MSFAVVEIQGKQFRVAVGGVLTVERMSGNAGDKVTFDRVLMVNDGKSTKIGTPTVKGAVVSAKILAQEKGEKLDVRRYKSKVRERKHVGFRPQVTKLEIISIS